MIVLSFYESHSYPFRLDNVSLLDVALRRFLLNVLHYRPRANIVAL